MARTVSGFSFDDFSAVSAVAEHGSFRAAARTLHVSPSTLSYVVNSVERRLGIQIFQRTTRSVCLTEAGHAFVMRIRPALAEMAQAIESVNQFRDQPTGQIRISTSNWAAERAMPIILNFLAAFPDVSVDIVSDGRLIDIVAEGYDAGLRLAEAIPQDMIAIPISGDESVIIVASPQYLATHGTPRDPDELGRHECVRLRLPSGSLMRWELRKGDEKRSMDVSGRLIVGASELALKAASSGAGIAYVDAARSQEFLDSGRLIQLMPQWTPPFPGVSLYYPRQRLASAAFRAFVEYVRANRLRSAGTFQ